MRDSVQRITMNVDGTSYVLAQGQEVSEIESAVVDAARSGADVVCVVLYGRNRAVDVVVTPRVPITFESEGVPSEARDDGDLGASFEVPDLDDDFEREGFQLVTNHPRDARGPTPDARCPMSVPWGGGGRLGVQVPDARRCRPVGFGAAGFPGPVVRRGGARMVSDGVWVDGRTLGQ